MRFNNGAKDLFDNLSLGSEVSFWQMLTMLLIACAVGIYIYIVYKNFCKSEFYSKDLNITIAGMPVVVAAIMIAMQSNLIVSLGMVGALSIVRFRTAIKSPIDLLYLFWTISEGIICGVGLYGLGILLCVMTTILLFILGKIPNNKAPLLLIVHTKSDSDSAEILSSIKGNSSYFKQKSVIVRGTDKELIYELRTKSSDKLISSLQSIENIKSINCLEHDGELRV